MRIFYPHWLNLDISSDASACLRVRVGSSSPSYVWLYWVVGMDWYYCCLGLPVSLKKIVTSELGDLQQELNWIYIVCGVHD
jgi:hypothetical protein